MSTTIYYEFPIFLIWKYMSRENAPSAGMAARAEQLDALLLAIGMHLIQVFAAESLDLSLKEMLLIELLGHRGSGTMSELASALSVPPTTLTSTVTRMVDRGYLRRRRIEEDQRVVVVSLTPKGRTFHRRHRQEHMKSAVGLLSALREDDQALLISVLQSLQAALSSRPVPTKRKS